MMDELPERLIDAEYNLRLEAMRCFKECAREVVAAVSEGLNGTDTDDAVVTTTDEHPILNAVSERAAIVHAASESVCVEHALRNTPYDEDWQRMNDDNLNISPRILASCILEHYVWEALKEAEGRLSLTRCGGHFVIRGVGTHDGMRRSSVSGSAPAADGGIGQVRTQPETTSPSVRAAKGQSIRDGVAQADRDEASRADGLTSAERQDLCRLRRENQRLREELEILAKPRPGSPGARPESSRVTSAHQTEFGVKTLAPRASPRTS